MNCTIRLIQSAPRSAAGFFAELSCHGAERRGEIGLCISPKGLGTLCSVSARCSTSAWDDASKNDSYWQQGICQHHAQQFPPFRLVLAVLRCHSSGPRANVASLCGRGAVEHAPEAR